MKNMHKVVEDVDARLGGYYEAGSFARRKQEMAGNNEKDVGPEAMIYSQS